MTPLKTQAIQTALMGDWEAAATLNKELLKEDPDDIETLNRLAFALSILGKHKEAKQLYQKVLKLDSQNPIALKNMKRFGQNEKTTASSHPTVNLQSDSMFLEESGKTKVIELINVAQSKLLNYLMTGEALTLRIKRLKIFVLNSKGEFIGMLPDDIAKRLIRFLQGGNEYQTYVKSVNNKKITVFIREVKRSKRFLNQPSFINLTERSKIKISYKSSSDGKSAADDGDDEE